jgi:AGCS family alanine or glycine:cation symporter
MRILRDYDDQRAAGIKTAGVRFRQVPDLDLDRKAWPANPPAAGKAQAEPHGVPAAQR